LDELLQAKPCRRFVFDNQHALGDGSGFPSLNRDIARSSGGQLSTSTMSFLHSGRRARPMQALRLNRSRPQPNGELFARRALEALMRQLPIWIMTAGVVVTACDRAGATSNANIPAAITAAAPVADRPSPAAAAVGTTTPVAPVREVTLPAGTRLTIVLDTGVGSDTSRVE